MRLPLSLPRDIVSRRERRKRPVPFKKPTSREQESDEVYSPFRISPLSLTVQIRTKQTLVGLSPQVSVSRSRSSTNISGDT